MIRSIVLSASLLAATAVSAQDLPTAPYLPLDMAQKLLRLHSTPVPQKVMRSALPWWSAAVQPRFS